MLGRLTPFGYATAEAEQRLETLMQDEKAVLVDIRYNPVSRWRPLWNRKALKEKWEERYFFYPSLGNVNYKNGGDIQLNDAGKGIPLLVEGLQKGRNLIILCACKQFESCHRHTVVELVRQVLPEVEVVI
jgi:hypothetical protein